MTARYALYLVPPAESALWNRGCRWLGRDPESGSLPEQPAMPGFSADAIREITRTAAGYGFHGTLKAPFRLADGVDESEVLHRAERMAQSTNRFTMPRLRVDSLDGFLALRPDGDDASLNALAEQTVVTLDDLRAPVGAEERARRVAAGLDARQVELLDRWGYSHVLERFRFHMTLTRRLNAAEDAKLRPWLQEWFREALTADRHAVDLAVFMQPSADADFVLRQRFRLRG